MTLSFVQNFLNVMKNLRPGRFACCQIHTDSAIVSIRDHHLGIVYCYRWEVIEILCSIIAECEKAIKETRDDVLATLGNVPW